LLPPSNWTLSTSIIVTHGYNTTSHFCTKWFVLIDGDIVYWALCRWIFLCNRHINSSRDPTPSAIVPDGSSQWTTHYLHCELTFYFSVTVTCTKTPDQAVYSGVPVFEMTVNNVAVMRRRDDSWLNATQILKVAGVEKGKRTKVLEKEILSGKHEKVQGGYGKYQGTW
jgi:hypothetical protein